MKKQNLIEESHPLDDFLTEQHTNNSTKTIQQHSFSDEERHRINQLAQTIEPMNHDALMSYGTEAQGKMSQFSHRILDEVRTSDVGPVGESLNGLMKKLKTVDPDAFDQSNQSLLKRIFKRSKASVNELFSRMQSVGAQIDRISVELEQHKTNLKTDIELLDQLYDQNKAYFDELTLYIAAAQQRRDQLRSEEIPKLQQEAQRSGNQMDVQAVSDMEQFQDRLEKRIHDLQLSRHIAIQTAPQIRMIQNVNQALAEKIQSSILTSIPLWKNQMSIALTLMRQKNAVSAQKAVTDTTNDLLLKNSSLLKKNAIDTAHENERGVVDMETLKTTQQDIIDTVEETLQIQAQGRTKRQQAEKELSGLENELKDHLISIKQQQK